MRIAERASGKRPPRNISDRNPKRVLDVKEEARRQALRLLLEIRDLALKIDVAFGGEPFLPGLSPTCPANRRRFEAFLDQQIRVARLIHTLVDLVICLPKEESENRNERKTAG